MLQTMNQRPYLLPVFLGGEFTLRLAEDLADLVGNDK
jgi:hypothetical protein